MKENKDGFYKGLIAGAAACVVGVLCAGVILHYYFGISVSAVPASTIAEASEEKEEEHDGVVVDQELLDHLQLLEAYVDRDFLFDRVDEQVSKERIYKAFLDSLEDPYTCYYTTEEFNDFMESTSGTYSGIGVMVSQNFENYEITVIRVFEGSPAEEAGMKAGDILVGVEDIDISEMELSLVVSYIKGEEGTTVNLKVFRPSENAYLDLVSERRTIDVPTVEYEMLDNSIGYLELIEFDDVTINQYKEAIEDMKKQGMKGLIVDLRDNPGGLMDVDVDLLDYMLPEGRLLYTEDKYGEGESFYSDKEHFFDLPLVVLVNENSASASEIFAGAIRDYDAGLIVGKQTFGKGIVQHLYSIPEGGGMKITVSRYFTPSGECIHDVGIAPDVDVDILREEDYELDIEDRVDRQMEMAVSCMNELLGIEDDADTGEDMTAGTAAEPESEGQTEE